MFRRRYLLVKRDLVSRGSSIVSEHWFRWKAEGTAARLKARHARQFSASQVPRFEWVVNTRCA